MHAPRTKCTCLGDKDCIQGSLARLVEGGQTWVKPLSDGSFAAALVNPTSRTATLPLFVASGLPEKYLWQVCVRVFVCVCACACVHMCEKLRSFTFGFSRDQVPSLNRVGKLREEAGSQGQ